MKKTILMILAFAVLMAGAYWLYQNLSADVMPDQLATQAPPDTTARPDSTGGSETTAPATEPQPAPDFTVQNGDGGSVNLSDYRGKPVILNFWASWCGPCKSEMPDFDAAYREYGDQIHFLMVNLTDGSRETLDTAKAFIREAGYSFPVYYDTTLTAASLYGASSIPVTFFLDAQGCLVAYGRGALDAETLQTGIDMLLPQP